MVYGDYDPIETKLVDDIAELCGKLYDKMAAISGITGLVFDGFDSSKQTQPLPQIGMFMKLADLQVDRSRAPAGCGNRLLIESGDPVDYVVDGETVTVYPERTTKHPLPVILTFTIDTWCHKQTTQLQIDQKILQTFPERGTLTLTFGEGDDETDFNFPIRLVTTKNLDDLQENYRERVYQFELELYTPSHYTSETLKVITSQIFYSHADVPADPTNEDEIDEPIDTVTIAPDEA